MKKKPKIFTHVSVDIDAVSSIWFFLRFILGKTVDEVELKFVPASWSGEGMSENDYALDIRAGGKGVKGENFNGKITSCLLLLYRQAVAESKINEEERRVLKPLVNFINVHDSEGMNALMSRKNLNEGLLLKVFLGLQEILSSVKFVKDDYGSCLFLFDFFDGFLKKEIKNKRAEKKLVDYIEKGEDILNFEVQFSKRVVFIKNNDEDINSHVCRRFFFRKTEFDVIIYEDKNGVRVMSKSDKDGIQIYNPDNFFIRKFIVDSGESVGNGEDDWYSQGITFQRGGVKSPVKTPTKVNLRNLAEIISKDIKRRSKKITPQLQYR